MHNLKFEFSCSLRLKLDEKEKMDDKRFPLEIFNHSNDISLEKGVPLLINLMETCSTTLLNQIKNSDNNNGTDTKRIKKIIQSCNESSQSLLVLSKELEYNNKDSIQS